MPPLTVFGRVFKGGIDATWAATVCDHVGHISVETAVLGLDPARPTAARRPAPPALTMTLSNTVENVKIGPECG